MPSQPENALNRHRLDKLCHARLAATLHPVQTESALRRRGWKALGEPFLDQAPSGLSPPGAPKRYRLPPVPVSPIIVLVEVSETRVVVADKRGASRYLRVTWHPRSATVVFSHWEGTVCTASTPVHLAGAAQVAGVLVRALASAVAVPPAEEPVGRTPASPPRALVHNWDTQALSERWADLVRLGRRGLARAAEARGHKRAG